MLVPDKASVSRYWYAQCYYPYLVLRTFLAPNHLTLGFSYTSSASSVWAPVFKWRHTDSAPYHRPGIETGTLPGMVTNWSSVSLEFYSSTKAPKS